MTIRHRPSFRNRRPPKDKTMMQATGRTATCLTVFFLITAATVEARPIHKQALADYFGPFLAPRLNDCRTCHLPDKPGEVTDGLPSEKPHNPFGARLATVKKELHKAGKKTDIATRLEAIADEDSDGDGVPNLMELLTGHNPGDPNDKPTRQELAEYPKIRAAFLKYRSGYRWRPFETVKRPAVPPVKNAGWVRNPIDAFIAAEHEEHGLKPRPEAGRALLLRRVYLDLTGLPPTSEELHAFLEDQTSEAYERVVDRLLASPRYGERWGRHWMDVWRYSDWAGYGAQVRDSQPHIWRWRDWIIESLNADKGYDRLILEMLAGDELAPEDPDTLRATGYLVRNYKLLSREKWLQDTVDHTAQAFLGVTLGCARCHDHMYDPILQKEYYQVRAIFEPHQVRTDRLPGKPDLKMDGLVRAYDADPQVKTFLFLRGDERTPAKTPLMPGVPEALGGKFDAVQPVNLPPAASCPDKRDFVVRETVAATEAAVRKANIDLQVATVGAVPKVVQLLGQSPVGVVAGWTVSQKTLDTAARVALEASLAQARQQALRTTLRAEQLEDAGKKGSPEWQAAATEATKFQRQRAVVEAHYNLMVSQKALASAPAKGRADAAKKVGDAEKALAKAEAEEHLPSSTAYTPRPVTTYPKISTGRRLAFARWIANRDNPLTARVAMNHLWLRHFGQAIVPSVYDFGRNGKPPSHPALLDWLAAEFMERGWSMKAMHRLMVTSTTYRMDSTADPTDLAIDRDNHYLWRMPSRRVEAEVVRDSLFYVAGQLDPTMGGPDIPIQQGLTTPRRSVYFQQASEKQMEFLKLFDGPEVIECYRRKESILPQQALALANSELTWKQAGLLARTLATRSDASDLAAFTTAAFEQVLSRPPTPQEVAECVAFLKQQVQRYTEKGAKLPADAAQRAREQLVHVLMNHHDFVTLR
jgi:hypothetical protein